VCVDTHVCLRICLMRTCLNCCFWYPSLRFQVPRCPLPRALAATSLLPTLAMVMCAVPLVQPHCDVDRRSVPVPVPVLAGPSSNPMVCGWPWAAGARAGLRSYPSAASSAARTVGYRGARPASAEQPLGRCTAHPRVVLLFCHRSGGWSARPSFVSTPS
jgi:hypothetical protein